MEQSLLFDSPQPRRSVQRENLERVRGAISESVLGFVKRVGVGGTFRGEELGAFVAKRHKCAPASSDRILRALRRDGLLAYRVDRSASLYHVEACK